MPIAPTDKGAYLDKQLKLLDDHSVNNQTIILDNIIVGSIAKFVVKEKIIWTLDIIEDLQRVPELYLKHLEGTDGLFKIHVQQGSDIFRIFCFFDQGKLVVLANGFQKKTQKTPKQEIEKALKIKSEYESKKK